MAPGWMQMLLILAVVLLLFGGRGRISSIMGDMANGIRSFRTGLKDEDGDKEDGKNTSDDRKRVGNDESMVNVTPQKDKTKSAD